MIGKAIKGIVGIGLSLAMLCSSLAFASGGGIGVSINGVAVQNGGGVIVNDRTLVPARSIFETLGAEVSWDEENKIVGIKKDDVDISLSVGFQAAIVNGEIRTLDTAPLIVGERTMIPLRFVSEAIGATVEYDDVARQVNIKAKQEIFYEDVESFEVKAATASGNDGNIPENTIDGDYNTRWSADGRDVWIEFELAQQQTVGYAGISWAYGDERLMNFELYTSVDGESYTKQFYGDQTKLTLNMLAYNLGGSQCKFIKLVGHGNTINTWNSMTEIKFYPPREDGRQPVEDGGFGMVELIEATQEIKDALRQFDTLFGKDVLEWIVDLYDPETGGFYFTKIHNKAKVAFLNSTVCKKCSYTKI